MFNLTSQIDPTDFSPTEPDLEAVQQERHTQIERLPELIHESVTQRLAQVLDSGPVDELDTQLETANWNLPRLMFNFIPSYVIRDNPQAAFKTWNDVLAPQFTRNILDPLLTKMLPPIPATLQRLVTERRTKFLVQAPDIELTTQPPDKSESKPLAYQKLFLLPVSGKFLHLAEFSQRQLLNGLTTNNLDLFPLSIIAVTWGSVTDTKMQISKSTTELFYWDKRTQSISRCQLRDEKYPSHEEAASDTLMMYLKQIGFENVPAINGYATRNELCLPTFPNVRLDIEDNEIKVA